MLTVMLLRMRVAVATFVALLALQFVDGQYFGNRYTRAATSLLFHVAASWN